MIKITKAASIAACLLLALSACTQEQGNDTASAVNTTAEQTQPLRIAAAANLSDVLPAIVESYKADKGLPKQDIDITFASSGKLYAQIVAGAPYDIFLSANQAFPAKLVDESVQSGKTHQPFTYAQGQLALYSVSTPLDKHTPAALTDLLMSDADSKITIANPELAPYGESAKAYLQAQDIYAALTTQKRIIQAENIGQAFQYAHTGSVDYGFVAQSQVTAIKAAPEQFITLAPESYPAILQDGLVISDASIATDFSDYLRSSAGQQHFSQAGYLTLQ